MKELLAVFGVMFALLFAVVWWYVSDRESFKDACHEANGRAIELDGDDLICVTDDWRIIELP